MRNLPIWLALPLLMALVIPPGIMVSARSATSSDFQSSANDLIAEVNALRSANGLPAYTANSMLMQVAQDQANYMAATGQVAHRPGLTQRILDAGYPLAGDLSQGGFRAENITGGNKTAAQAVQEWTGDALHLNTMLSPNLTEIGAGVVKVGDRYYLVIVCAQPTTSGAPQAYTPNPDDPAAESSSSSDFIVPLIASTPDENGFVYHEVQYGQTLWAIAIEYGVKIDEIRALNNLGATTEIYQGDRLLVRKDAPPSPVAVTVENTQTPTETIRVVTATSVSTPTPLPTATPTLMVENPENSSVAGIALGIVLVTLLFAGVVTWMNSHKPA
ncbi:MAG: LysM peptidoglycan-binding domain-containing protein [Anaerolineales bacterium]|nr:LysM peptidoglycan-binding domain-containing protein [Anaerolineales bacterium]